MSRLSFRGSVAGAAVVLALLASGRADAQSMNDPGPPREPNTFVKRMVTGVTYDAVNQGVAENRVLHFRAKLDRDAARGRTAAAEYDARKIERLQFRIAVDDWLIKKNQLYDPGCYPYPVNLDPMSCAAIASASRPAR